MASNWIKMRDDLWTHPKFIGLCNALIYGDNARSFGLAEFVFGEAEMMPSFPGSDETITEKLLHTVTKRSLQAVTMCSLLKVWQAVNAHSKVSETDAILEGMLKTDLDEIAGFSGFSDALEIVGWLESNDDSMLLIFKNFCEFNEPSVLRKKEPMSNAERQKKHRLKKALENSVTNSNESNAREEKRREEKNIYTQEFELFWKEYPRHTSKDKAMKAWKSAGVDLQTALKAVAVQKQGKQWQDNIIPHASTWLNQKRWEDEIAVQTKKPWE